MTVHDGAPDGANAENVTVLVFGADRQERLAAQRTIAAHGYRVLLASSRAEAAKCIASGRVRAIVVTDDAPIASEAGAAGPVHGSNYADGIPIIAYKPSEQAETSDESAVRALIASLKAATGG